MSNKSKLAVVTAASIGIVLTQSSPLFAEIENNSAPEKVTKIAAPIDLDEEVLYSALPDEALEKAAKVAYSTECLDNPLRKGCSVRALPKTNAQGPSNGPSNGIKPTLGGTAPINPAANKGLTGGTILQKNTPLGGTGPTVPPKPIGR